MLDFGQILSDVAPDLVGAGLNYLGAEYTAGQNDDAADAFNAATQAAANTLDEGYRQQLGHIEQGADRLNQILQASLADTTTPINEGYQAYNTGVRDAYGDYAEFLYPQHEVYGQQLNQADDLYRTELNVARDYAKNVLGQGADAYASYYDPYIGAGDEARLYMQGVMQQDPSQMNPYQEMLIDDYRRDAIARNAASGLRGAGRAGVAAVNEGEARLLAELYRQNQGRSDQFAGVLGQQGYGASGQVAANEMGYANSIADLDYRTAGATAGNTLRTGQQVANTYYDIGRDVAGKIYSGERDVAQSNLQQGKDQANLIGQYYGNVGNVEAGRYGARGDTAFGMATNNATAQGLDRNTNFARDNANNQLRGDAIGKVANTISSGVKESINNQRSPATVSV